MNGTKSGKYDGLALNSNRWFQIFFHTYGPMSPGCTSGGKICPSNEIVKQVL